MDRKEFIKTCGYACLGTVVFGAMFQSCAPAKHVSANITDGNIVLAQAEFLKNEKYLKYIIVENKNLQYPIYVFRFSEKEYSALLLQCSHQGNELNAYGDKLVCSAHGSEFDNKGNPTNGPATEALRAFPIQIDNQNITISLKKL